MTVSGIQMKSIVALAIIATMFLSMASPVNLTFASSADSGEVLDLYTQKDPYSGRGLNQSSDAFGPREEVEIYALATRSDCPIEGLLVAFQVFGPLNDNENITFCRSGLTDENGIAMVSFRLSYFNITNFGEWEVIGNTRISSVVVQDMLLFEVGWVVQVTAMRTVNPERVPQERFTRGGSLGLELEMQSISLAEKRVTLGITICDSLGTEVSSEEINDAAVPPNSSQASFYFLLDISRNAFLGEARVYACAYTNPVELGGVPYCPEKSATFLIISRDVAVVKVQPSKTQAIRGETIDIDVCVENRGWESESFEVKAYFNETIIDTSIASDLGPKSNETLRFVWNTESAQEGTYVVSASAEPVPGEIDLFDNVLYDGLVEIKPVHPPYVVHDVAVSNVTASRLLVFIGESVEFQVVVSNCGDFTETFQVTVFGNSTALSALLVENLEAGEERTLLLSWNTSGVQAGNYTISALAGSVPDEVDLQNNLHVNGVIKIAESPKGWSAADLTYWFVAFSLLAILAILLLAWLYRRKRRNEESFYSGWTAWYYGHDLRE